MVSRWRSRLWHRLTLVLAGLIAFVTAIAAVAVNQLAMGVKLGIGAIIFLREVHRRLRADLEHVGHNRNPIPFYLVFVPVLLVTFRATVLPRAAGITRSRYNP